MAGTGPKKSDSVADAIAAVAIVAAVVVGVSLWLAGMPVALAVLAALHTQPRGEHAADDLQGIE